MYTAHRTINGYHVTVNRNGTPLKRLWDEHLCLNCESPLAPDATDRTFCRHCLDECHIFGCRNRAVVIGVLPESYKGMRFCLEHNDELELEAVKQIEETWV